MTWFKVDDGLHSHPKWLAASAGARALWVTAGSWCASHLTDGHVPRHALPLFSARPKDAAELVRLDLWGSDGDGWVFHDWLEFQPSRERVTAEREVARRRQAMNNDPELRKALKARDGDGCRYCGRRVNWRDRKGPTGGTYDHVIPIPAGGDDTLANLVVCCRACNTLKQSRTPEQAGMTLRPPSSDLGGIKTESRRNQDGAGQIGQDTRPDPTRPAKEQTSSDYSHSSGDPADDDQSKPGRDPRAETVLAVLADRDLNARVTAKGNVGDTTSWTNAVIDRRRATDGKRITALINQHPELDPDSVADLVAPPVLTNGHRDPKASAYDNQQRAQHAAAERHLRVITGEACQACNDTGWTLDEDGNAIECRHQETP